MITAAVEPWVWNPRPEVWALVAGIIGLGYYAAHVIGPKVVPRGQEVVSRKQRIYFVVGVVLLAIAGGWPMHDIAERYLYSVHMFQHLLISFFIPVFFLQATPVWLARLILGSGNLGSTVLSRLVKPVVAGVIFNAVAALTHWNTIVQRSVDSGPFHYSVHLVMFWAALLMWMPILGPLPEYRISPPAQMVYLFLMSVIPTVPGGWLTFADNVVYPAYDTPERLWGISVINDQQAAGFIMKIVAGLFLWTLIAVRFFGWAGSQQESDLERRRRRRAEAESLDASL